MKMTQSRFFCTQCGKEGLPVMRKVGHQREPGHLKKLYCIYCGEQVNHVEIKETGSYTEEDFKREFKLGRFKDGQREEKKDLLKCSNTSCPFNVNGKCWNSNNSNECRHKPKEEGVDSNE